MNDIAFSGCNNSTLHVKEKVHPLILTDSDVDNWTLVNEDAAASSGAGLFMKSQLFNNQELWGGAKLKKPFREESTCL